ncbi:MAG: hypothetical protein IIZ38_12420 [Sphingomonas sp.]|uniref:hypothetical protein n=1 Tax=unclassified Sphingomonas TaxID=196159 RepID=UPI002453D660|nr:MULTISPECIES: hypothetical protein [unclassified Sphingomonas]MBQ1499111.1 hypothetical protein [Sphingomonas sp.]MDH4746106.1 hypothetical protein [Sphingomonas sp. CBMAI 2297]
MSEASSDWDHAAAARLDGATVLVGLTFVSAEGERREQVFGTVMEVGPGGITLRLEGARGGELFALPPDLDAFAPADPGIYRLRETGEKVIDPDFTAAWTVSRPAN